MFSNRNKKSSVKNKLLRASVSSALQLVIKSGKYIIGYNSTLNSLKSGKSKLVIISDNCPKVRKLQIEYYAMLLKMNNPVEFPGSNIELMKSCGKFFRVSMISI